VGERPGEAGAAVWPGGAPAALSLSFDNLGEAAELELGAWPADAPLGEHFTATRVLPALLEALAARDLAATFFVEGLNAELYPDALVAIAAAGHEVAYHAWRHEQWDELSAAEQKDNLARGLAAFRDLGEGVELAGLRPPGGQLGAGGLGVPFEAGLRYCSPAGEGAGVEDGIALLPFQWRHVDATCLLPGLTPVRERMTGSPEPLDPGAFLAHLEAEVERLAGEGGFLAIVLHLTIIEWLGWERLGALLDRLASARLRAPQGSAGGEEGIWVAPCEAVAAHVLAHRTSFHGATSLDRTSWSRPEG
jgi:peptidoglycan/xylan/chitin deacetylase (PgdA/CDA1 family)